MCHMGSIVAPSNKYCKPDNLKAQVDSGIERVRWTKRLLANEKNPFFELSQFEFPMVKGML